MTTIIAPINARLIDTASDRTIDYQAVANAGFYGAVLYVGNQYGATVDDVRECFHAGLRVLPNREGSPSAYLGGYAMGRSEALTSLDICVNQWGWAPSDSPLVFSGTDTTVLDTFKADAYYRGAFDVLADVGGTIGAYGPAAYLRHLSTLSWVTESVVLWHWAGDSALPQTWTDVQQDLGQITVGGATVDTNRVIQPIRMWTGFGTPVIRSDVTDFRHADNVVYQIDHGYKYHVTGDYFFGVLQGSLAPDVSGLVVSYPADSAKLNAIPDPPANGSTTPISLTLNGSFTGSAQSLNSTFMGSAQ
jgi:hypothetical protein